MASEKKTKNECIATEWLEEDNLMLLECWARDGYTFQDIANRIGISISTLRGWRVQYPDIDGALKKGREIIDYKVENALLKSALGYKTKEVKVTTTMRYGKVVETVKETLEKEQAPNVSAIQCWLYNRCKDKWRNMNAKNNMFEDMPEDDTIEVIVRRAGSKSEDDDEEVEEKDIVLRKRSEEESNKIAKKKKAEKRAAEKKEKQHTEVIEDDESASELDEWPDDWEDDDE